MVFSILTENFAVIINNNGKVCRFYQYTLCCLNKRPHINKIKIKFVYTLGIVDVVFLILTQLSTTLELASICKSNFQLRKMNAEAKTVLQDFKSKAQATERRLTYQCITIVLVFVICNSFYMIYYILRQQKDWVQYDRHF